MNVIVRDHWRVEWVAFGTWRRGTTRERRSKHWRRWRRAGYTMVMWREEP